jgi:hypothetical protein
MTKESRNPNLTGYYPELRDRVLKLKELGISVNKFTQSYCESNANSILKWATTDDRPLNHNLVPVVEKAIQLVKERILEV